MGAAVDVGIANARERNKRGEHELSGAIKFERKKEVRRAFLHRQKGRGDSVGCDYSRNANVRGVDFRVLLVPETLPCSE